MVDRVVLYIEDDLASRIVMSGAMRALTAVELLCVATGAEGLAVSAARRPNLVLLDSHLPDMSGLEVMARLVAQNETAPVLVVSADVRSDHVDRMLEAGASGCIAKPLDLDELAKAVVRFVA
jgi:CheY-like chemotaxis protein